jgi:hypothetical protein
VNRSFSVVLFVVPLGLCGVVWAIFGAVVGSIALVVVLALMAFNTAHIRSRSRR